ncbi:MAG: hypothetical protein HFJ40_00195 [Clostridia bacterium]|nr:hypothetical protein [Clostridia bacterium]
MELQEKNVKIRKLTADENKIIISKETQKDENGNDVPVVKAKEIYLAKEDSEENYVEVEEETNE